MNTSSTRCLPLALVSLLLPSFAAAQHPSVFDLEFSARFALTARGALIGRTTWSLTTDSEQHLVYESKSVAAGIAVLFSKARITERSEWIRHGESWQPIAYQYARSGKKAKQIAVSFDWNGGIALNTAAGRTWSMPLPAGTLDKLGYLLAMMRDLAAGERDLEYAIADGGKLKLYRLKALGTERLETPIGPLQAVKVTRLREDSERETTFWCAPVLKFLPVKIEHRETDGSIITLTIEAVEGIEGSGAASLANTKS